MIHYAENDEHINAGWPAYQERLKANKVNSVQIPRHSARLQQRHHAALRRAAKLAWQRTVDHFKQNVANVAPATASQIGPLQNGYDIKCENR